MQLNPCAGVSFRRLVVLKLVPVFDLVPQNGHPKVDLALANWTFAAANSIRAFMNAIGAEFPMQLYLSVLHAAQRVCRFSGLLSPPRDRGLIWSTTRTWKRSVPFTLLVVNRSRIPS